MTTVIFIKKKCFVCETTGKYVNAGLTDVGKPYDLDGRPDGSFRSIIYMIIQRCPVCNYCSPDITQGAIQTSKIIKCDSYLRQLHDKTFPDSANSFLCWAIIQKELKNFKEAGKASLNAAWICDDNYEYKNQSIDCRKKALFFFKHAKSLNQALCNTTFEESLLLIDLMRRCGMFKESSTLIKEENKRSHTEKEELTLQFQEKMVENCDVKKHTISEVFSSF